MTDDKVLVLVCNSHIDPVWLWRWEEGLAETLATFRAAAALAEEFDSFVFCHNEALLYRWVEEHERPLFERIRDLVGRGRWHVMGGWYLQPDCNLPSGESLVRQILVGKRYFLDRFGVEPIVAVNLDPFGHTRGLVQILRKAGHTGYLFCRPDRTSLALPADDFVWVGYDGSAVIAHRASDHYNSSIGQARGKVERWLAGNRDRRVGLLLWGVGNHGGGPSREDLRALAALIASDPDRRIRHGRPEDYFAALEPARDRLPRHESDLNPWAVGCYTTMSLVKSEHRRLESALFAAEKMLAAAALERLVDYPARELDDALEALLFCEFHDILPGSSIQEVEAQALRRLSRGHEIVEALRARAFFAMLSGQRPAADGEFPIVVHNPHPFAVDATVVCEFQPTEPNADRSVLLEPELRDESGVLTPCQVEKESCNIQMDQRKRIVFRASLAPSQMSRFPCRLQRVTRPVAAEAAAVAGRLVHHSDRSVVEIDGATGLIAYYAAGGVECLHDGARLLVMRDYADPWGMKVSAFRDLVGRFELMDPETAAAFAGVSAPVLAPVRVIEQGAVRTVVEALFAFGRSTAVVRYALPSQGSEIEVDVRVYWMEKDRMLKLAWPTPWSGGRVIGQVAYGVEIFQRRAEELVAQKWIVMGSDDDTCGMSVINDTTYGFDADRGELRLSLLRAAAFAGHPVDDATPIVRQDRFEPRIDQGERRFRFWIDAGPLDRRLAAVDREATVKHEFPMALVAYPPGPGRRPGPFVTLSDDTVQLAAARIADDGGRLILRLFEPTGRSRSTTLEIRPLAVSAEVRLGAFEIKTIAVDLATQELYETDLLERRVGG